MVDAKEASTRATRVKKDDRPLRDEATKCLYMTQIDDKKRKRKKKKNASKTCDGLKETSKTRDGLMDRSVGERAVVIPTWPGFRKVVEMHLTFTLARTLNQN